MRFTLLALLALGSTAFAQHGRSGGAASGAHGGSRVGGRRSFGGGAVYVPYPIYGYGYGAGYGAGYGFDNFYPGGYPGAYAPAQGNDDPSYYGYDPNASAPGQPYPASPTVIINQNFQTDPVRPQLRDYSNTPLPQPGTVMVPPAPAPPLADDQPTIFLIAMQDHTIVPVIAYWVQGDTLNYISLKGVPNHVSVTLVDRDFSKQLNAERNVPFALPAAR